MTTLRIEVECDAVVPGRKYVVMCDWESCRGLRSSGGVQVGVDVGEVDGQTMVVLIQGQEQLGKCFEV